MPEPIGEFAKRTWGIEIGQIWRDMEPRPDCNTGRKVVVGFAMRGAARCAILQSMANMRKTKVRLNRLSIGYKLVEESHRDTIATFGGEKA